MGQLWLQDYFSNILVRTLIFCSYLSSIGTYCDGRCLFFSTQTLAVGCFASEVAFSRYQGCCDARSPIWSEFCSRAGSIVSTWWWAVPLSLTKFSFNEGFSLHQFIKRFFTRLRKGYQYVPCVPSLGFCAFFTIITLSESPCAYASWPVSVYTGCPECIVHLTLIRIVTLIYLFDLLLRECICLCFYRN